MAVTKTTTLYQVNYSITTGKGKNKYTQSRQILVNGKSLEDATTKFRLFNPKIEPASVSRTNYEVII
jgi:hypothetical protein